MFKSLDKNPEHEATPKTHTDWSLASLATGLSLAAVSIGLVGCADTTTVEGPVPATAPEWIGGAYKDYGNGVFIIRGAGAVRGRSEIFADHMSTWQADHPDKVVVSQIPDDAKYAHEHHVVISTRDVGE